MGNKNFVQTAIMFEVMSDRDLHFPRFERHRAHAEYGMSKAQFLDEHEKDAFADVQELWDRADFALRRELLKVCQERVMRQVFEMEELYRNIEKELHDDAVRECASVRDKEVRLAAAGALPGAVGAAGGARAGTGQAAVCPGEDPADRSPAAAPAGQPATRRTGSRH